LVTLLLRSLFVAVEATQQEIYYELFCEDLVE
jgi:hypothetical protein